MYELDKLTEAYAQGWDNFEVSNRLGNLSMIIMPNIKIPKPLSINDKTMQYFSNANVWH